MAVHADPPIRWGLLTRIKAAAGRLGLDRRLAEGASPGASRALARRAQVLSGHRERHVIADGLERVVAEAIAPPHSHGAGVPVQRQAGVQPAELGDAP